MREGYRLVSEDPKNYSIKALWNGEQIELIDKREMIKQMDLKQKAEEVRDLFIDFVRRLYKENAVNLDRLAYEDGKELLEKYAPKKKPTDCPHLHLGVVVAKPKNDSIQYNTVKVPVEQCHLYCLDCGYTSALTNSDLKFASVGVP